MTLRNQSLTDFRCYKNNLTLRKSILSVVFSHVLAVLWVRLQAQGNGVTTTPVPRHKPCYEMQSSQTTQSCAVHLIV